MKTTIKDLFQTVLSRPTAPFRESWVMATLQIECFRRKLPHFEDSFGNLWVGVENLSQAKNSAAVFVAHTDHPGFVINSFSKKKGRLIAKAKWLGGGPTHERSLKYFPVKVFSHFHGQTIWDGQILSLTVKDRSIDSAEIEVFPTQDVSGSFKSLGPWAGCLWFDEGPVSFKNNFILSKAVDDLVGVCLLLEALSQFPQNKRPKNIALVFSRAEESGFNGVLGILQKKILNPEKTAMISVETSRELPGAECGKGPVIRLGDRTSVFDSGLTQWIYSQAKFMKDKDQSFLFQRRLMDGGSCEASAFNAWGFKTAGISIPLRGYHNINETLGPCLEQVNLADCMHGVSLLYEIFTRHKDLDKLNFIKEGYSDFRQNLLTNFNSYRHLF